MSESVLSEEQQAKLQEYKVALLLRVYVVVSRLRSARASRTRPIFGESQVSPASCSQLMLCSSHPEIALLCKHFSKLVRFRLGDIASFSHRRVFDERPDDVPAFAKRKIPAVSFSM